MRAEELCCPAWQIRLSITNRGSGRKLISTVGEQRICPYTWLFAVLTGIGQKQGVSLPRRCVVGFRKLARSDGVEPDDIGIVEEDGEEYAQRLELKSVGA